MSLSIAENAMKNEEIRAVPFHVGSYPHDVKKFRAS